MNTVSGNVWRSEPVKVFCIGLFRVINTFQPARRELGAGAGFKSDQRAGNNRASNYQDHVDRIAESVRLTVALSVGISPRIIYM